MFKWTFPCAACYGNSNVIAWRWVSRQWLTGQQSACWVWVFVPGVREKLRTGFTWRGCGSSQAWTWHSFSLGCSVLITQTSWKGDVVDAYSLILFYFSLAVLQALEDGLKKADADPSVKAVMICGENGKFSAGKTSNTGWAKDETLSTHHVWKLSAS